MKNSRSKYEMNTHSDSQFLWKEICITILNSCNHLVVQPHHKCDVIKIYHAFIYAEPNGIMPGQTKSLCVTSFKS